MDANKIRMIYSTFPNKAEALTVADALISGHLAACVNIIDQVTSVYRWQGQVETAGEVLLLAKTTEEKTGDAIAMIKRLHSYELPCIIAYLATAGFAPFLEWITAETRHE